MFIGWGSGTVATQTSIANILIQPVHVGFVFDPITSANWRTSRRTAAGGATSDAGVTVVQNTWYRFRIRRIDASTIGWQINNNTEITNTTFIPVTDDGSTTMVPFCWLKTLNATAKTVVHDLLYYYADGVSR